MYKATIIIIEPLYINNPIKLIILENRLRIKRNKKWEFISYTNIEKIMLLDDFIHIRLFNSPFDAYLYIRNPIKLQKCFTEIQSNLYEIIKNTYNPIHFQETI
jgi:hypothetical protein